MQGTFGQLSPSHKVPHGREQTTIATSHYVEPEGPQKEESSTIRLEGKAGARNSAPAVDHLYTLDNQASAHVQKLCRWHMMWCKLFFCEFSSSPCNIFSQTIQHGSQVVNSTMKVEAESNSSTKLAKMNNSTICGSYQI